jgi:hypothetical protein
MAEPNNAGPAPETNSLSDGRRAIIASLELVRVGRDKIDEAKAAKDPAILTTPEARLLFTALANVGLVTDALSNIPKDELCTMTNEEVFAANAWVGPSERDGVVLGARILLNEAREFVPRSEKWITWGDINRLHDRISGREAETH